MPASNRLVSAIFSALPGFIFLILFLGSSWPGRDYWWETYLVVLIALVMSSLILGFAFPPIIQRLGLRQSWIWILIQGLLAWIVALILLGLLNLTPLCVGQDNGDGNNNLGMCMFMTMLSAIVYSPVYLLMLVTSAMIGNWLIGRNIIAQKE